MALVRRDGHYGLENKESGREASGWFEGALSYLTEDSRSAHFVIHVRPMGGYLSDLNSSRFLDLLGFRHFSGCQFFGGPCYYRYVFESPIEREVGHARRAKVDYAHQRFRALIKALPSIYEKVHAIYSELGSIPELFPSLAEFGPQPMPDFSGIAPSWIASVRVPEHGQVERQIAELSRREKYFSTVEYILWGSGAELEDAVQFVLEDLGFAVQRLPKGSTIDRLVTAPDPSHTFGVEITGLNESIKKKSNKIGQALTFLQQREGSEKPVILANTHNHLPLSERTEPSFTSEALDLIRPNGIVGLTTVTLYDVWKRIKDGRMTVETLAQKLYEHPGGEFRLE